VVDGTSSYPGQRGLLQPRRARAAWDGHDGQLTTMAGGRFTGRTGEPTSSGRNGNGVGVRVPVQYQAKLTSRGEDG
jgi:hypothetical protein